MLSTISKLRADISAGDQEDKMKKVKLDAIAEDWCRDHGLEWE